MQRTINSCYSIFFYINNLCVSCIFFIFIRYLYNWKYLNFLKKKERKKRDFEKFVNKINNTLYTFYTPAKLGSFVRRAHASRCADEQPAASDDTSWINHVRHYGLSFARRSRRWSRICVLTSRNNRSHRSFCPCYSYNYLQNNLPRTPRL